jgi:hypothetical protein
VTPATEQLAGAKLWDSRWLKFASMPVFAGPHAEHGARTARPSASSGPRKAPQMGTRTACLLTVQPSRDATGGKHGQAGRRAHGLPGESSAGAGQ